MARVAGPAPPATRILLDPWHDATVEPLGARATTGETGRATRPRGRRHSAGEPSRAATIRSPGESPAARRELGFGLASDGGFVLPCASGGWSLSMIDHVA
jgi:hypothetical protein